MTAGATAAGSSYFNQAGKQASDQMVKDAGKQAMDSAANTQIADTSGGWKSTLGTIMNSRATGPLLSAGVQGISGYMQGKQQQEMMEESRPLSFWGAGARGEGGGPINSPFATGESLTNFGGAPSSVQSGQRISPYVADPRAGLPDGNQWMQNLPNGNQGLMALGWDINTGQPYDPNNDPNNPPRYN